MNGKIKRLVTYYKRKFQTNNPFEIADRLGVLYQFGILNFEGCYMFLKNHRYIFLNQELEVPELNLVMAHELGHAILHRKQNCYFIKDKTLLLNSKIENEANKFAAELIINDDILLENKHLTTGQLSRLLGYQERIIELKME